MPSIYPDIGGGSGGIGPGLEAGIHEMPTFDTDIQSARSGYELRTQKRDYPLYTITVGYSRLNDNRALDANAPDPGEDTNRLRKIVGFFLARRGKFEAFLLNNPRDNHVTDQIFSIGDGSTKDFQLTRAYGIDQTFAEPVMNLNGTATIKVDGVLKTVTTDYTISDTGLVSFVTAPAIGLPLTWTGHYYYRCRFDTDMIDMEQFLYDLYRLRQVTLVGCLGNKI